MRHERGTSERGAITFEFLVALPLMATVIAVLIQWLLLLNSQTLVSYAAFCAARSAAVWLPRDPTSMIGTDLTGEGTEATQRVQHAAAIACIPLSPRVWAVATRYWRLAVRLY